jgi:release factor glutamine methyltransferase
MSEVSRLSERLARAGCVAPDEEAAELLAVTRDPEHLEALVARRERGEPLAWLVGGLTFCDRWVHVDEGIYVPRWQSEVMARRAGESLASSRPGSVAIDLCTGAGAVAHHLAQAAPHATVLGVELDRRAARCAARNGVSVLVGDLDQALLAGRAALVTAVAPYVPTGELGFLPPDVLHYEPLLALDGGPDGLVLVRRVIEAAARLLMPGGTLALEVGGDQDAATARHLDGHGFIEIEAHHDHEGDLRWVSARRR